MPSGSPFLQSIENLRSVQWSNTLLWDIKFGPGNDPNNNPAPPSPFDTWIPATDYNEITHTSNTLVLPYYLSQYKFLESGGPTDINMNIHDDVYGTMLKWLTEWYTYCLDDTDGVTMLEDGYRTLYVVKTDGLRNVLKTYTYYVIPEGSITETLNSLPDTKSYNLSFNVIGRQLTDNSDSFKNQNSNTSADDLTNTDQSILQAPPTFGSPTI